MLRVILPVRTVTQATPRTRIIHAELQQQPFAFHAGQAVSAGLEDSPYTRPYSIACSPGQAARNGTLELLVQTDDHRAPDPHLERAQQGTNLRIEGPFGRFRLADSFPETRLLFVAGGTGIAPLRSMMWDALERFPGVRIALIYSARTPDEFAYREELDALASAQRIDLLTTVTRPSDRVWTGSTGRIDRVLLAQGLASDPTRCLVCGPEMFVSDTVTLLRAVGVAPARIVTESHV